MPYCIYLQNRSKTENLTKITTIQMVISYVNLGIKNKELNISIIWIVIFRIDLYMLTKNNAVTTHYPVWGSGVASGKFVNSVLIPFPGFRMQFPGYCIWDSNLHFTMVFCDLILGRWEGDKRNASKAFDLGWGSPLVMPLSCSFSCWQESTHTDSSVSVSLSR